MYINHGYGLTNVNTASQSKVASHSLQELVWPTGNLYTRKGPGAAKGDQLYLISSVVIRARFLR